MAAAAAVEEEEAGAKGVDLLMPPALEGGSDGKKEAVLEGGGAKEAGKGVGGRGREGAPVGS